MPEPRTASGTEHVHLAPDGASVRYFVDQLVGPPRGDIVLLHGGYGSPQDWRDQAAALADAGYRVLRPAQRGHVGTDVPATAPVSMISTAQDVVRIMDELGMRTAHLAGWSYGGSVALRIAKEAPDRLRSIALLSSFAAFRSASRPRDLLLRLSSGMASLVFRLPGSLQRRMVAANIERMIVKPARPANHELATAFARSAATNAADVRFAALMMETYRTDARDWLGTIRVPALVLTGTKDYIPAVLHRELAAGMPHGELEVVPGGRHTLLWERPQWLTTRYLAFLAAAG